MPELEILGSCTLHPVSLKFLRAESHESHLLGHFHFAQKETPMGKAGPMFSPLSIHCPECVVALGTLPQLAMFTRMISRIRGKGRHCQRARWDVGL